MSRISFQEKMLWAQLLAIVAVVLFYGHFLVHARPGHHYFHALLIGILIVFLGIRLLVRFRSRSVLEDERDSAIAAIGTRWSNLTLWLGIVVLLVLYWDHGSVASAHLLIGLLFHLLVLAGSLRVIRELVAYRRAS